MAVSVNAGELTGPTGPTGSAGPTGPARLPVAGRALRRQLPWLLLTVTVAVLVLMPLIPLQWRAFADGAAGLRQLVGLSDVWEVFRNTALLGIGAVVVGITLGTVLALSVNAMPPRLRRLLAFTPVLPMIIPSVAHVVGFVFLFSPENGYVNTMLRATPLFSGQDSGPINVYTPFWIIVYTGVHLAAFVYLFVYSGLQNLGPDYALAARVNGAGGLRALFTVTLPMLRPVFLYSTVVVLLLALGQFTGPLLLGRREGLDVLTTKMYVLTQEYPLNYGLAAAFGTPLIVMALVLVVVQRWLLGNQNRFVGRGDASAERAPTRPAVTFAATTTVALFVLISAVLPLLALLFVSLSPFWTGDLSLENLTTRHFGRVFDSGRAVESIVTSLNVSLSAVLIVIPLGMLIALALYNRHTLWRPLGTALDNLSNLPLALPAALVGFGFLFAYSSPLIGLHGSRIGLTIAYVTVMIPFSVRYQLATLVALGRSTVESSRVSGGGALRTFFRILLPLSRRGIASSAAIMFVLLIHEFGVSVLLRAPDTTVMSVVLFDQYTGGTYPQVAVMALVMTAITSVGVIAALLVGGSKALERL